MEVRTDVAELLRQGLSNAEVGRRTGAHPVEVGEARRALGLPSFYALLPAYEAPPSQREHGTRAKYFVEGCRCAPCRAANRAAAAERSRLLAYGKWHPWVDAEPVRTHLRYLQTCGMGLRAIGAAAGVHRKQLQSIVNGRPELGRGPQKVVRPALAATLLDVQPTLDTLGASTVIPAAGTTRRLQALVAVGWPQTCLAKELGWAPNNLSALIVAPTVMVRTARLVRDLYERLWKVDPLTHGATQIGVSRAKKRALQARWAPVAAWDDDAIDDPAAFPDWTGRCGTAEGYRDHYNHHIPVCDPCRQAAMERRRHRVDRTQAHALRATTHA